MIEISALILGLISWFLILYCIFKHKKLGNLKIAKLQVISWVLCSIALYLPSISLKLEHMSDDYAGVIDTVGPFHLAETILLLVNLVLNIILLFLTSKSIKKQTEI